MARNVFHRLHLSRALVERAGASSKGISRRCIVARAERTTRGGERALLPETRAVQREREREREHRGPKINTVVLTVKRGVSPRGPKQSHGPRAGKLIGAFGEESSPPAERTNPPGQKTAEYFNIPLTGEEDAKGDPLAQESYLSGKSLLCILSPRRYARRYFTSHKKTINQVSPPPLSHRDRAEHIPTRSSFYIISSCLPLIC